METFLSRDKYLAEEIMCR